MTIAGAVANDVHGKNHHRAGTFGRHVKAFELLRSDGTRLRCSPAENADWFRATIGGLGLTGLVTPNSTFPEGDFRAGYFRGDRRRQVF